MTYRICSKCGTRPAQEGQSYCKECHAEYMKSWRSKAVSVRLDDDTYEWVRQRSGKRSQPISEIVAEALRLLRQEDERAIERGITRIVQATKDEDNRRRA
jgi:hypothetical protein